MEEKRVDEAIKKAVANINVDNLNVNQKQLEIIKEQIINNSDEQTSLLTKLVEITEENEVQKTYGK